MSNNTEDTNKVLSSEEGANTTGVTKSKEDVKSKDGANTTEGAKSEKGASGSKGAKPKRWKITLGVIVVVVILAGIGMFSWHNTPSFCGTVCHTPMSEYTNDFNDPDAGSSTAKLASYHSTKDSINCLSCHDATIEDQVHEATNFISGDYNFDGDTGRLESRSDEFDTLSFCTRSGCHSDIKSAQDLTAKTSNLEFNPHNWEQHGVIDCSNCHQAHKTSEFYCAQCHLDATYSSVPEGWNVDIDGTKYTKKNGEMVKQE